MYDSLINVLQPVPCHDVGVNLNLVSYLKVGEKYWLCCYTPWTCFKARLEIDNHVMNFLELCDLLSRHMHCYLCFTSHSENIGNLRRKC